MNTAAEILRLFDSLGVTIHVNERGKLAVRPADRVTPEIARHVKAVEGDIRRLLQERTAASMRVEPSTRRLDSAPSWRRDVAPNSRSPLVPPAIREKIESIETDARAKGWPAELLWNSGFWDSPRGLACLLDESDEIVEVTVDEIVILKLKHDLQRFRRRSS